jgi:hypothetical protein
MAFPTSKETYVICEMCRKKIQVGKEITIYGPDEVMWFDNTWHKRVHWFCSESCVKEYKKNREE